MNSWFVLKSGTVVGPINSDKVLSHYNNQNVMVWGIACNEWLSFSDWSNQLDQGVFDVEPEPGILLNPKLKNEGRSDKALESKVFKIKPDIGHEQNPSEDLGLSPSNPEFQDQDKTSVASLPDIPNVDDIFASSNMDDDLDESETEVSNVLNSQLIDILDQSKADDEGHTLVQATMDGLLEESENLNTQDGATQVQSAEDLALEPEEDTSIDDISAIDMSTKVQSIDDLSLELDSDGSTKVQTSDEQSLDLEEDDSMKSSNEDVLDLELKVDEATKVQGADALNLEINSDDLKTHDMDAVADFNLELESASEGPQAMKSTDEFSLDFDAGDDVAENELLSEFSLDHVSEEEPTNYESNSEFNLEFDAPSANKNVQAFDEFGLEETSSESVDLTSDDEVSPDDIFSIDLNEKTNIAELKEVAFNIEKKKALETPSWYVAYDGKSEGPMNVEALLKKLDSYKNPEFVYLWKKGMKDWQNLYDTPQISSQLGIGFRRHERIAFSGTVKIEFKDNVQIGQLENLSLSGVGATGFGLLPLGEIVKVTLDCTELKNDIEFVAKIRFTNNEGILGLSYVSDQYVENVNKVIELVQRHQEKKAA